MADYKAIYDSKLTTAEEVAKRVQSGWTLGMDAGPTHANGMVTVYSNLKEEVPVKVGDVIASRTVIGQIGDTALEECLERSHLHFEIRINGEPVNPAGLILFRQESN